MRIAVSGIGVVSALGIGTERNLDGLKSGRSGISPRPGILSTRNGLPVGELKLTNAELKFILGIPEDRKVSRTALLGAVAASEAMKHLHPDPFRTGFINATSVGGMDLTEDFYPEFLKDRDGGDVELCRMHDCGASTRFIADYCGIRGYTTAISTACSSGANAIMLGARLLKHKLLDCVVVGGTDALSRFTLNGFKSLMILDRELCRPFDSDRHGLNLGEGAGYLVLQREEDCHTPLAWLSGWANANDAHHQTASSADGDGAYIAMSQALERAGMAASEISCINAHGTGTGNNDLSEGRALIRLFGDKVPAFSSTKGYTGHTLAAAGGIEAVFSVLSLCEGCIWPNPGWRNPMPEFDLRPETDLSHRKLSSVMSNSFGFGGNCSSLIFSATDVKARPAEFERHKVRAADEADNSSGRWFYINAICKGGVEADEFKTLVPDAGMRRRMSKVLKESVGAAAKCISRSCEPDAIITATGLGCLADSEKFLQNIVRDNEELLNPTPFIQSTFNTAGGQIALLSANHCYNMTYVNRSSSFADALTDALMMLEDGEAANVLAGAFDENIETSVRILESLGVRPQSEGAFFLMLGSTRGEGCVGRIRLRNPHTGDTAGREQDFTHIADDGDITAVARALGMKFDGIETEWIG